MATTFDYKSALVKLIGKDQEFLLDSVKVNNEIFTKVSTWEGKLNIYRGSLSQEDNITSDVLSSVYAIVKTIREDATQNLININKELLGMAGYDMRYYKPANWQKSFETYSLNRLLETLGDYQRQLNFKKNRA